MIQCVFFKRFLFLVVAGSTSLGFCRIFSCFCYFGLTIRRDYLFASFQAFWQILGDLHFGLHEGSHHEGARVLLLFEPDGLWYKLWSKSLWKKQEKHETT